ncbi:MAG TPA: acetate--CoA ligase family protein [Acidimicrobiales bacterium]|jgi:acyl-CoA synthetase (NDP forming)|nr:acetate--CoA ligase family protein [Acidimicrobiales bacterium]
MAGSQTTPTARDDRAVSDVDDAEARGERATLDRLLRPRSVAVVGASDTSTLAETVASIFERDVEAFVVNPKYDTVFGHKTFPSLSRIGRPVDAVFSLLSASGTVALAEDVADTGSGGLVVVASGFAEVGGEGVALQERLVRAARRGNFPVVGPNGVGYLDIQRGHELTFLPRFDRRKGGVSVVAHSGALLEAVAASAWRVGGVGFNLLISAGNEAVTDMADYLDHLVDDPATRIIALALEKVRRPEAFFAAAARALRAGKPIIALKLGRSARGRRMTQSHTGTVIGDAWVYDVAFRQAGIDTALEVDELVDRLQFLEQLPAAKWSELRGLGVLTGTGGFATMTADLAEAESIDVPEIPALTAWVQGLIPSLRCSNPLDATGAILSNLDIWDQLVTTYAGRPELDALIFLSQFAPWDTRNRRFSDRFAAASADSDKPFLLSPLAGQAGGWMEEYQRDFGIAIGNGLRGTLRGLQSMSRFARRRRDAAVRAPSSVRRVERPGTTLVGGGGGESMLSFADAMALLAGAGIEVAPFEVIGRDDVAPSTTLAGPLVVKLGDVAHRTEHGAVLLGVDPSGLGEAVAHLRALAESSALPATVVVQPQLRGHGEVFLGLSGASELGPVVAFGLGGVFVEVLRRVSGRLAPFGTVDAAEMIAEFDDLGVADGFRGSPPWDRATLAELLVRAGDLAAGARGWLRTFDVNPLIQTDTGFVAVDGTCFVESPRTELDTNNG